MRKVKAIAANGKRVLCEYTPLTDPKLALKYADILSDKFNDVVTRTRGDRIEIHARNSHTPRRR